LRLELDGDWAEIRPANKIPHGLTMEYREVFFDMAAASVDAADIGSNNKAASRQATRALFEGGALRADQRLKNALVLAVVKDWSYGPVDLKTLLEVPTADLTAIIDSIDVEGYVKVLTPDFGDKTDREPGSPT
jgi:hypothetical protein